MATATRFHKGWSGSTKHTDHVGDGSGLGDGPAARPSERGIQIGPGAEGRSVRPAYDSAESRAGNDGVAKRRRKND